MALVLYLISLFARLFFVALYRVLNKYRKHATALHDI